jgi:hypothetical protein
VKDCRKELNDLAKRVEFLEKQIVSTPKIVIQRPDGKMVCVTGNAKVVNDGSGHIEVTKLVPKKRKSLFWFIKNKLFS